MLKEFAFTPQIFDPDADPENPDWQECLRAVGIGLFLQPVPMAVVSGLHCDGETSSWESAARENIRRISNPNLQVFAQQLFQRMHSVIVRRQPCCDWPGDDEPGWGKEAAETHAIEPLHQVIAHSRESVPVSAPFRPLASVLSADFWTSMGTELKSPQSLAEEVARLRPVLVHSESLVISAPYGQLTPFVLECIAQATRRPAGFPIREIHVHQPLSESTRGDSSAREEMLRRQLGAIAGRPTVRWWLWPGTGYKERIVLGGHMADLGNGVAKFAARFGVAMTHVWGDGDPLTSPPRTFSLLSAAKARQHMDAIQARVEALNLTPALL